MTRETAAQAMPRDPREWRPLEAKESGRKPEIKDPIIEPLWQGTRVLAHYHATPDGPKPGAVELLDGDGFDVTEEFAEIVASIEKAVVAHDAVIDGILTDQALAGGDGVGVIPEAQISPVGMILGRSAEVTVSPGRDRERGHEVSFVALDLLAVDGEPLFDLPLLERKRQLDGLIVENELTRVSPFARPPLQQWLNSWRSAGFRGVVMKAANSRYYPDDVLREWAIIDRVSNR